MANGEPFALNRQLDADRLRRKFAAAGRLQIRDWLEPPGAEALREELASSSQFRLVINGGSQVFEIPRAAYEELPSDERRRIETAVHAAAREGFQFCFETIRVPDDEAARARSGTLLDRFASFHSSREVLEFVRHVTGEPDIDFADAQGTRYQAGDFLTAHDDAVEGKHRRLAYVLGLTAEWSADWGGLLHFIRGDGTVAESFLPQFNALSLFAIGQKHSVGVVAPFAGADRLSMTGWFRASPR